MKVGLFIPCYVDAVYPEVGIATWKLLKHLGIDVTYPEKQTCCGQPMANAGFEKQAIPLAEKFEEKFKDFDYVVAPSVSCTAFVKLNYPRLLSGGKTEAVGGMHQRGDAESVGCPQYGIADIAAGSDGDVRPEGADDLFRLVRGGEGVFRSRDVVF